MRLEFVQRDGSRYHARLNDDCGTIVDVRHRDLAPLKTRCVQIAMAASQPDANCMSVIDRIDRLVNQIAETERGEDMPELDTCHECGEVAAGFSDGIPYCAAHYLSRASIVSY
jgi:hypothetical protein